MNGRSNEGVHADGKRDAELCGNASRDTCHHVVAFEYGEEPEQGDAIAELLVDPPAPDIPWETQPGQSIWRASITATSPFRLAGVGFASLLDQPVTAKPGAAMQWVSLVIAVPIFSVPFSLVASLAHCQHESSSRHVFQLFCAKISQTSPFPHDTVKPKF